MKLEYKQFDFTDTLREIDSVLKPENDQLIPKNQFVPNLKSATECAYAGVIAVCVRMKAYDNSNLEALQRSYELVKQVLLDIFRDNGDCIDTLCLGRYLCGIYNAPVTTNVNGLIITMAKLNAALSVLDIKLYERFKIHVQGNCGCDYGALFRVQTSYYKYDKSENEANSTDKRKDSKRNDSINDKNVYETWHGAALNLAMLFAEHSIMNDKNGTIISETIKSNIKEEFANFFPTYDSQLGGYWASLVDSQMFGWVKANR